MATLTHRLALFVGIVYALLSLHKARAQVITAPDKGDELEARAYAEAQGGLKDELRSRDSNATIDIDVYTYDCVLYAGVGRELWASHVR